MCSPGVPPGIPARMAGLRNLGYNPAMTTLFISDLHLSASHPEITRAFEHFLNEQAQHAAALYILGDFFEAWVGDDDDSDFIRHIKNLLKALSDSGVKLFIMRGNRDFLLGKKFCSEVGASFLPDPSLITINNQRVLLTHGDYLCTDDRAHQAFRRKADHPQLQKIFLCLPLFFRHYLADRIRAFSLQRQQTRKNYIDVNQTAVEELMKKHDIFLMIHGHTHRPNTHEFELTNRKAKRVVLRDWDENYYFYEME